MRCDLSKRYVIFIQKPIIDPASGDPIRKSVFYIVSIGKKLSSRLAKLCDYFEAHIFTVPEGKESFQNRINDIHSEIIERDTVLAHSKI